MNILKRDDSSSDIQLPIDPNTNLPSNPYQLSFNASNWNVAQTVTLTAPLETTINNGTAYFYVYAPNNPEYGYHTVTANEIGVGQFLDDSQVAAASVVGVGELVISGDIQAQGTQHTMTVTEGSFDYFTVALAQRVTSPITISIVKQLGGDADLIDPLAGLTDPVGQSYEQFQLGPNDWDNTTNQAIPHTVFILANNDADAINGTAVFYVIAPGYINQAIAVSELDTSAPPTLLFNNLPPTGPVIVTMAINSTGILNVSLPFQPPSNVTLTVTREAGGDAGLQLVDTDPITPGIQNTLSFTTTNWNTPQTITFSDTEANPNGINGAAVFYLDVPGYTRQKIFVVENDGDPADFNIGYTPTTARIVVVPEGGTNTFTVVLNANPAADTSVNVAARPGSDQDLTAQPATLQFTHSDSTATPPVIGNWNTPQTVTVTAAADTDTADGIAYFDVSANGLTTYTVTVIEDDNTPINLLVSSNTVFVPEGSTNTFSVQLSAKPLANVIVTIGNQATTDGGDPNLTSNPNALIFTTDNWNTPQTVTIRAAEDADNTDGTRFFYVQSSGMTTQVVTAMELDNDVLVPSYSYSSPPPVVSLKDISVLEGDTTGHIFYVRLPSQPTYAVTVNIDKQVGGDAAISADKSSLTFTTSNWSTWQQVKVTSTNDANTTNGIANFYISAIGYTIQTVEVTQIDKNASPIVITGSTVWVPEGGYYIMPVKLAYQPISPVTVTVNRESGGDTNLTAYFSNATDPSAFPSSFTFASTFNGTYPVNQWDIPQMLVIYDAAGDTNGTATFDLVATTPTSEGSTTPVTTFPTTRITANEINYGSTITTSTDAVQVLEGSTSTFSVTLALNKNNLYDTNGDGFIDANDIYTVTIARQAGGDPNIRAIPTTLTFTGANYNTPQYVKILNDSEAQTAYTTDGSINSSSPPPVS